MQVVTVYHKMPWHHMALHEKSRSPLKHSIVYSYSCLQQIMNMLQVKEVTSHLHLRSVTLCRHTFICGNKHLTSMLGRVVTVTSTVDVYLLDLHVVACVPTSQQALTVVCDTRYTRYAICAVSAAEGN